MTNGGGSISESRDHNNSQNNKLGTDRDRSEFNKSQNINEFPNIYNLKNILAYNQSVQDNQSAVNTISKSKSDKMPELITGRKVEMDLEGHKQYIMQKHGKVSFMSKKSLSKAYDPSDLSHKSSLRINHKTPIKLKKSNLK